MPGVAAGCCKLLLRFIGACRNEVMPFASTILANIQEVATMAPSGQIPLQAPVEALAQLYECIGSLIDGSLASAQLLQVRHEWCLYVVL